MGFYRMLCFLRFCGKSSVVMVRVRHGLLSTSPVTRALRDE